MDLDVRTSCGFTQFPFRFDGFRTCYAQPYVASDAHRAEGIP